MASSEPVSSPFTTHSIRNSRITSNRARFLGASAVAGWFQGEVDPSLPSEVAACQRASLKPRCCQPICRLRLARQLASVA